MQAVWMVVWGSMMFLAFLGLARVVWMLLFDDEDPKGGSYGRGA
jgi:hypothetical protein